MRKHFARVMGFILAGIMLIAALFTFIWVVILPNV
jgi:hypothetical protein